MTLRLDWCGHDAAKYACEKWHYSRNIPKSKTVKIGVWEEGSFVGCIIFSYGATPQIGKPFRLKMTEICELTRIALRKHTAPVSRIMAIAVRMLRKLCPGIKLIISYADLDQNHHGGVYQAANWLYVGKTKPDCYIKVKGVVEHRKSIYDRYGCQGLDWLRKHVDPQAERIADSGKHKYVLPLDDDLGRRLQAARRTYPKRAGSKANVAPADQAGGGGATPTSALHTLNVGKTEAAHG